MVSSLLGDRTLAAGFVDARAADVAHPFDHVVVTVVELGLEDLQVADLETRGGEGDLLRGAGATVAVGSEGGQGENVVSVSRTRSHLEVHGDGRTGPFLLVVGRQEFDLGADLRLLHPGHAFDPADRSPQRWVQRERSVGRGLSKQQTARRGIINWRASETDFQ